MRLRVIQTFVFLAVAAGVILGAVSWMFEGASDVKELRINNLHIQDRCGKLFAWDRRNW
jgi:hypothetical protein